MSALGRRDRPPMPPLNLVADFAGKTRDEWAEIFAGTDACVTAVLNWTEAATDPHMTAR